MNKFLKIFCFLIVVSCQNESSKNKEKESKQEWEKLKINKGNETVYVYFIQDTCYYHKVIEDTVYAKLHNGTFPSESIDFLLSKLQRDTVLALALEAITRPVQTDQTVSDYAGQYVSISLEQYSTKISLKYSSVHDWTIISPTLTKLSKLTFGKVKKNK